MLWLPTATENALPQSAEAFVGHDPWSDDQGEVSLHYYVDMLLNSDLRYTPLPANDPGIRGALMDLWHMGSDHIPKSQYIHAASRALSAEETASAWDALLFEASQRKNQVASWIRMQFTDKIADQYTSRVPDWKAQLAGALDAVREHGSRATRDASAVVAGLEASIGEAFKECTAARRYSDLAHDKQTTLARLGIAYYYNWLSRGLSYRIRLAQEDTSILFTCHDLRGHSSVVPGMDTVGSGKTWWTHKWGDIVVEGVRRGHIKGLPHCRDVLDGLYESAHDSKGQYVQILQELEKPVNPTRRETLERDLRFAFAEIVSGAAPALLELRADAPYRSALEAPEKAASRARDPYLVRLAYQLVLVGAKSSAAKRTAFHLLAKVRRDLPLKVFRVPGLED